MCQKLSNICIKQRREQTHAFAFRIAVGEQNSTQIALGNVQNATDQLKLNFDYGTTNNNGNVLSQTITVPTVGTTPGFTAVQTYTYDSLNRIHDAKEMIGTTEQWKQTFQYDRYGNRTFDEGGTSGAYLTTNLTRNCATSTANPNGICDKKKFNPVISATNNRLILDQDADSQNDYSYDLVGNTTKDADNRQFIYDAENKQIEVKDANNVSIGKYFYDGDGKRVKKISATETTVFVYNASGQLVAEYSTQIAQAEDAKVSYLTNDHLGSPRITTDANGQVISRRDFQPFGEEIARVGYGTDNVRKHFATYERDGETGLDFAQARYYSKNLGRFNSVDSIMMKKSRKIDPQQINLYAYVRNNPLAFVDVSGNDLIPADAKSARQLRTDLAKRLSKAELANLRILSGKNIVIVNSQFQSNSTAYQQIVQAVTSSKITTYFSVAKGKSVTVNIASGTITLPWNSSGCSSNHCATVDAGATVPIDTNDIRTANTVNIYVPESGSVASVLADNGQGQTTMTRDVLTFHEIGHSNCGPGQCAVKIENDIRGEQIPPLPTRGGQDHESLPTDSVQPNTINSDTFPDQIIPMPNTQIGTTIESMKPIPLPTP